MYLMIGELKMFRVKCVKKIWVQFETPEKLIHQKD